MTAKVAAQGDLHNGAVPILLIAALAQLLDGIQRVAMGALYGLQDTRIPMLLSGVPFWGVGLTSGYLLGFPLELNGVGLWTGQSIGVSVAGGDLCPAVSPANEPTPALRR